MPRRFFSIFPTFLLLFLFCSATACRKTGEGAQPDIRVSDVFRDQIMKFLQAAGELDAATASGVGILDFKRHVARVESSYNLTVATWPTGFNPGARVFFANAMTGWRLALTLWSARFDKTDPPTEPNVNGYAELMAYAPNNLQTHVVDERFIVKEYRGKKQILKNGENVSSLLTLASFGFSAGKTTVLASMAD